MTDADEKFQERARRFISRTPGDHDKEQTIQFIAEIYRIENQLVNLENRIDEVDASFRSGDLKTISRELSGVSNNIQKIQKGITSPDEHLHESLNIEQDEIDPDAVSEILTQLGWEWFPRELNRLYSTQDRVFRKADAKKQQFLTNRIVLLSFIAVILSVTAIIGRFLF